MAPSGLLICMPPIEPKIKRAVAFFDGQNLYRHAKEAFGHTHPNYHPENLFKLLCKQEGWDCLEVRFYTGTPSASKNPMWHGYWANRLLSMKRSGIKVFSREIKYHSNVVTLDTGPTGIVETSLEKGIDIRIALDVVRCAVDNCADVIVIFSQDQDLSEVVNEVKHISQKQNRWIRVISAYPTGPRASTNRGINGAQWLSIDQTTYDSCLDPRDYRPSLPTPAVVKKRA